MNFFLFQVYPYIALTVLVLGSIARYERDPFTWKSSSSRCMGSSAIAALASSPVRRRHPARVGGHRKPLCRSLALHGSRAR